MRSTWLAFLALLPLSYALDQDFVDDFMEKIQEIGTVCAEETHATADDIAELIARQFPPSTHEGKCLIFCVQRNLKLMKAEGGVDRAGAMAVLRPLQKADPQLYQKVLKVFITCGMRVKPLPDPCETAAALLECGNREADAMGLDMSMVGM